MYFDYEMLASAAKHSVGNYEEISESHICGCYHCRFIFYARDIDPEKNVVADEGVFTVTCLYCGNETVIGDYSGYPITDEFLDAMNEYALFINSYKKTR